jgi:hypothetical protein
MGTAGEAFSDAYLAMYSFVSARLPQVAPLSEAVDSKRISINMMLEVS